MSMCCLGISFMQKSLQAPYEGNLPRVHRTNVTSQTKLKTPSQGLLTPSGNKGRELGQVSTQRIGISNGRAMLPGLCNIPSSISFYHISLPHWWCGCQAKSYDCSKGAPKEEMPGTRTHSCCTGKSQAHLPTQAVVHPSLCWMNFSCGLYLWFLDRLYMEPGWGSHWGYWCVAGLGVKRLLGYIGNMIMTWLLQYFWSISNTSICCIIFSINSIFGMS